jgi:hypothetical protein
MFAALKTAGEMSAVKPARRRRYAQGISFPEPADSRERSNKHVAYVL